MTKQTCTRCLYDEDVPNISFSESGQCSYCDIHDAMEREFPNGEEGHKILQGIVDQIKRAGHGKKYDCIVGVSGGCDSTYLLYTMKKKYGLRPLAVFFDNTWTATIATSNIRNALQVLDVDLITHVVNNREYDDIYRAMMRAGVADIEAPTDLGFAATLNRAAAKYGIHYVIEGHSFRTEGVSPLGWLYMDSRYVRDVHETYGSGVAKTLPTMGLADQLKWMCFSNIKKIRPLYYMDYNKAEAMELMSRELGWQWYGGHHLDNRFTAFYHRYFMPVRFGTDQRVLGYSALMRSGQMTREEAEAEMRKAPEEDPDIQAIVKLVKKRLGFSDNEFASIMNGPKRNYKDFANYKKTFERLRPFLWLMYKTNRIPKSFYMKFAKK